ALLGTFAPGDRMLRIVGADTGKIFRERKHPYGRGIAWSPDSRLLYTGGNVTILCEAAQDGAEVWRRKQAITPRLTLALSPDGAVLACRCEGEGFRLHDARTGDKLGGEKAAHPNQEHWSTPFEIAWAADSRLLLT